MLPRWLTLLLLTVLSLIAVWLLLIGPTSIETAVTATVEGSIVDADGPIEHAAVRVRATDNFTTTSSDGHFALGSLIEGQAIEVTAWADGYYIASAHVTPTVGGLTLTLRRYHTTDHPEYTWPSPISGTSAGACGNCHPMIVSQWITNGHGSAAFNPRFHSLYNGTDLTGTTSIGPGYLNDFPGTAGNCANCHAPGAGVDGYLNTDMNSVRDMITATIHCDYCHKIGGVYLNPATGSVYANAPGVRSQQILRPPPDDNIFFGPYDDIKDPDTRLPMISESAYCAPCHQFSMWGTPIYQSFAEWRSSPYAAAGITCQKCHMPPNGDAYFALPEVGGLEHPPEMNLLFDLDRRPIDEVWSGSLDVRGERDQVLAVWRTFQLLSQRASGLRAIQTVWREFRDREPQLWGALPAPPQTPPNDSTMKSPHDTGWRALDYLDYRHPEDVDLTRGPIGDTVLTSSRTLWDGYKSLPWWTVSAVSDADLMDTMQRCRLRVSEEINRIIPDREPKAQLYDLMRAYPAREGKGLRPTEIIASCCAFGGRAEDAVRIAAAIELFHNGFLVHDDIADESTHRRNETTLHAAYGVGLAVNAGDGLNLLAVDTVLSNLPTLGLARTLGLIHEILHMCRETIEGQAVELGWIHDHVVPARDEDYFYMSTKKTGWYTCITPVRIGAVSAGETDPSVLDRFNEVFRLIGIAFQIQDDVLNLIGEEALYGKEPLGDLLEGKRTIMLIHLFRQADEQMRARLYELLRRPRAQKTFQDAEEILAAMKQVGSLEYAIEVADRLAHEGVQHFEEDLSFLPESEAKAVLRQIANYVTTRPL